MVEKISKKEVEELRKAKKELEDLKKQKEKEEKEKQEIEKAEEEQEEQYKEDLKKEDLIGKEKEEMKEAECSACGATLKYSGELDECPNCHEKFL